MLARFLKFVSTNPLISAIVGTFIGTVLGTQYVAWKAPDVSGVFGDLGRWLRAPAGSTRVDEITLALLALLLGFISCTALFLREAQKQRQREQGAAPPDAPAPPRAVPADFAPTGWQAWVGRILLHHDPDPLDLDVVFDGIRRIHLSEHARTPLVRAQVARDLDQLVAAGIARYAGSERVYALTKLGRDWLLEQEPPRQRPG
jgi:hypothetical protein